MSSAETEDEDLSDYLVPRGSTATIACELESPDLLRFLEWNKDGRPIQSRGSSKYEHVVNGPKHYLIIHVTEPADSGVYSVLINGLVFKVAQITVSEGVQGLLSSKSKHISSSSLYI